MNDAKLGEWLREELPYWTASISRMRRGVIQQGDEVGKVLTALVALLGEAAHGIDLADENAVFDEPAVWEQVETIRDRLRVVLEITVAAEKAKPCCWQLPKENQ